MNKMSLKKIPGPNYPKELVFDKNWYENTFQVPKAIKQGQNPLEYWKLASEENNPVSPFFWPGFVAIQAESFSGERIELSRLRDFYLSNCEHQCYKLFGSFL